MIITHLTEIDKSKIKVFIDDEYAFWLYQKEFDQYRLVVGEILPDAVYEKIIEDTIYHRALQKAMAILEFMDRSEQELRNKLEKEEYSDDIIVRVLQYVKHYDYLNDRRYAAFYIRARMNRKSKLMIKNELLQKGVDRDMIEESFLSEYGENPEQDPELIAIKKAVDKKTRNRENLTYEEKQKIIASLFRKGYDLSKIRQFL